MESGLPQGSILGPILFSIYVNNLSSVLWHCLSESYVDDTELFISFPIQDWARSVSDNIGDLHRVWNWCFSNCLLLNPDKTQLMLYRSRQMLSKLPDVCWSLLWKDFTPTKAVKDFSVTFHPNLTFCDHIIKTFSSCMSSLSQISRVTHMFGRNTLIRVVNSLVFRKLFYRSSVWSNAATTHILKLQAVQNFASRMISNTRKFDNVTPILKDLRWFPVKYQLYYRDAVLAFHCMTGLKPLILPYFS